MGRENNRKQIEYRQRLGFNPRRYIRPYPYSDYHNDFHSNIARTPMRGDVWFADLGQHEGTSVQSGCRPVIIVSNDAGNIHADTVNVLPMTRHLKKPNLPCHAELHPEVVSDTRQQLDVSMVLAEQITTVSKTQLRNYAGRISNRAFVNQIDHAVSIQLGLEEYEGHDDSNNNSNNHSKQNVEEERE